MVWGCETRPDVRSGAPAAVTGRCRDRGYRTFVGMVLMSTSAYFPPLRLKEGKNGQRLITRAQG